MRARSRPTYFRRRSRSFRNPRVDAHALIKPARQVGGDFFDAIAINEHCICFAVGDVSGKGMPAALFMVRVVTLLRLFLMREDDPARVLPELNGPLCEANDEFMFVTLAVAILDTASGRLTYLNAGHNPPFISSQGLPFGLWEPPRGPILGVERQVTFATKELTLHPGDAVVLYTDGVTEAENSSHEFFGVDRAARALSSAPRASAADFARGLENALSDFVGSAGQSDDITLFVLRYLPR